MKAYRYQKNVTDIGTALPVGVSMIIVVPLALQRENVLVFSISRKRVQINLRAAIKILNDQLAVRKGQGRARVLDGEMLKLSVFSMDNRY